MIFHGVFKTFRNELQINVVGCYALISWHVLDINKRNSVLAKIMIGIIFKSGLLT